MRNAKELLDIFMVNQSKVDYKAAESLFYDLDKVFEKGEYDALKVILSCKEAQLEYIMTTLKDKGFFVELGNSGLVVSLREHYTKLGEL
jgi:hypothetical protein